MEYTFVELKQRHIEAWSKELPNPRETKTPVYNGAVVRAAIKAGWFEGWNVKPEFVDDMPPMEVRDLAMKIVAEYSRVMDVSPE